MWYAPARKAQVASGGRSLFKQRWEVEMGIPRLAQKNLWAPENFISLLYYFGLLSMAGTQDNKPLLRIPNRTVKDLMSGYLRHAVTPHQQIAVHIDALDVDPLQEIQDRL